MARTTIYDQGYQDVYSLTGSKHKRGLPLLMVKQNITVTNTATSTLMEANGNRLWAEIINNDNAEQIVLYLGETWGYYEAIIQPHGSYLINRDNPWSGAVYADNVAGSSVVISHEVSIQP